VPITARIMDGFMLVGRGFQDQQEV
jgi:hypothetical protein